MYQITYIDPDSARVATAQRATRAEAESSARMFAECGLFVVSIDGPPNARVPAVRQLREALAQHTDRLRTRYRVYRQIVRWSRTRALAYVVCTHGRRARASR